MYPLIDTTLQLTKMIEIEPKKSSFLVPKILDALDVTHQIVQMNRNLISPTDYPVF